MSVNVNDLPFELLDQILGFLPEKQKFLVKEFVKHQKNAQGNCWLKGDIELFGILFKIGHNQC